MEFTYYCYFFILQSIKGNRCSMLTLEIKYLANLPARL